MNCGHTTEEIGAGNIDTPTAHTFYLTGLEKKDFGFPGEARTLLRSYEEITGMHWLIVGAKHNTSLAVAENAADKAVSLLFGAEFLNLFPHVLCRQVFKDVHIKAKPTEHLVQSDYER